MGSAQPAQSWKMYQYSSDLKKQTKSIHKTFDLIKQQTLQWLLLTKPCSDQLNKHIKIFLSLILFRPWSQAFLGSAQRGTALEAVLKWLCFVLTR